MAKELTDKQGEAIAMLYLGKVQRGIMTEEECEREIENKLKREGYGKGSILGVLMDFNRLVRKHGDYKW